MRAPAGVALGALAPLAIGAALSPALIAGGPVMCPFRLVTGLPCPLCGATRAFVAAGHGDHAWVTFNGYWVIVSAVVTVTALVLVVSRAIGREPPALPRLLAVRGSPLATSFALALVALPGWAWALVQHQEIT